MSPLFLAAAVMCAATGSAETPPTPQASVEAPAPSRDRLFLESLAFGSVQRTGAIVDLRMRYRHVLYAHDHEAFNDNFVGVGAIEQATPIFSNTGVYAELQPASFFRLTATYQLVGYFGTFGTMRTPGNCEHAQTLGPDDARCPFPLEDATASRADYGHRVAVEAFSQARLGRFYVSNTFSVERWMFRDDWASGAATHWINEMFNVPMAKNDTLVLNNATAMFDILPGGGTRLHLAAGVMSDLAYAVGTDYRTHRVGFTAMAHLPEWHSLRDVAAVLMVQWYTHDRYTRGAMPMIGVALTVTTPNFLAQGAQ